MRNSFLLKFVFIIYILLFFSCGRLPHPESLPQNESEVSFSFQPKVNFPIPFSLSTEMQIFSWELFLYDKTISTLALHKSRVESDPLNPEPFAFRVIPNHEYELKLYVNDALESHDAPRFAMSLPAQGKQLPGAAQRTFMYSRDGFESPVIVPQVFRLEIGEIENALEKSLILEDIYLASAARTSGYTLVDTDGYCSYSVPYFYDSIGETIDPGDVMEVTSRLYAFPLLADAPEDMQTFLMLSTNRGFYYYPLPRNLMGPGVSLKITRICIRRLGGETPFQEVLDVEISKISIVDREKEGNEEIVL